MTKKHYEAIAKILTEHDASNKTNIASVARCLTNYFATDNPKFDSARFLEACGIEK